MTWQKFLALFNTDSLAIIAVGGLILTLVATIAIFAFLMTRRDTKQLPKS